jgi:hypothetical protein
MVYQPILREALFSGQYLHAQEAPVFAIIAAILFAIAFIMDLAGSAGGDHINPGTLTAAGLVCVALHLAGAASWNWGPRRRRR